MNYKPLEQYLLDRRVITLKSYLRLMQSVEKEHRRIGEIAVSLGHLTQEQASDINMIQLARNVAFGEVAVEIGALTETKLEELIEIQRNNNICILNSLKHIVSVTVLEQSIIDYNHYIGSLSSQLHHHLNEIEFSEELSYFIEDTHAAFRRVLRKEIFVIDFVNTIAPQFLLEQKAVAHAIYIMIKDTPMRLSLIVGEELCKRLAGDFLEEEPLCHVTPLAENCMGEILNIVMGYCGSNFEFVLESETQSVPIKIDSDKIGHPSDGDFYVMMSCELQPFYISFNQLV